MTKVYLKHALHLGALVAIFILILLGLSGDTKPEMVFAALAIGAILGSTLWFGRT